MPKVNTQVLIDKSTLDLFMSECESVHVMCDRSQVPREIDGEPLSFGQRVAILENAYRGLAGRLGMDDLFVSHH